MLRSTTISGLVGLLLLTQPSRPTQAGQAAPEADVALAPIASRGSLPPSSIRQRVRSNLPRVRACYERELGRRPQLAFQLVTRFIIEPTGQVLEKPHYKVSPPLGAVEAGVLRCVTRALETLRFPAVYDRRQDGSHTLGRRTTVRYRFRFKPAKRRRTLAMVPRQHTGVQPRLQRKWLKRRPQPRFPTPHTLPPIGPLSQPATGSALATPPSPTAGTQKTAKATATSRPVLPLPKSNDPIGGLPSPGP